MRKRERCVSKCVYIYVCKKCVWDKERETMKMEREKKIVKVQRCGG